MAASIKGKIVVWGIPTQGVTAATNIFVNSGVVQSFDVESGGATTTIADEDDDAVTRIDHNYENKVTIEVVCVAATVKPAKGAEISGSSLGTIDGIVFSTGRTFVDSAKVTYTQGGAKKMNISATHYPGMGADA